MKYDNLLPLPKPQFLRESCSHLLSQLISKMTHLCTADSRLLRVSLLTLAMKQLSILMMHTGLPLHTSVIKGLLSHCPMGAGGAAQQSLVVTEGRAVLRGQIPPVVE